MFLRLFHSGQLVSAARSAVTSPCNLKRLFEAWVTELWEAARKRSSSKKERKKKGRIVSRKHLGHLPMLLSLLRDNNYIKDFPQLADGLMVIPLPVEEQCRGVLSEPLPNLQLLTGTSCCHSPAPSRFTAKTERILRV